MEKIKTKPYEKLALVYDHLMNHVNYDLWTRYVYKISSEFVNKNASVLEIAAGNGNFTKLFNTYYKNIIVTDLNIQMLSDKKNSLPKICCEMTNLPFKKKFNLIYSTFDSINYLTNKRLLLKLFLEIRKILDDNGIFTFDVSLERNSELYIAHHEQRGKANNIIYNHSSTYNKHSRIHRNIFEIKMKDGTVYKEVHNQKIYPFEVYFSVLDKAGLYVTDCYEAFSFKHASVNSKRVQFVVKSIRE